MELHDLAYWLGVVLRLAASAGVLGLALAVVRPRLPRAGWALGAAAGVDLLSMCCSSFSWRALGSVEDYEAVQIASIAFLGLDLGAAFLVAVATIAGLALLAADAKKRAASG